MATTVGSLKRVKISSLHKAAFNPKTRQRDINTLMGSIERVGLLYPILVNKTLDVIDGHRRLSACEKLGWETIPVLCVEGEQSELFSEVSTSNRQLRGNETLHVYLKEPRAIGVRARGKIESCENVVGRETVRALATGGFSMATWDVARRICKEADQETPAQQKRVMHWLIKHRCAGTVEKAIRAGVDVGKIMQAVARNKPIQAKYSVTERD